MHQFGGRAWSIWLETMSDEWNVTFDKSFGTFRSDDLREVLPVELLRTVSHKCYIEAAKQKENGEDGN